MLSCRAQELLMTIKVILNCGCVQKEIEWRDKTYSSELKDIKVSLFPDRLEIEKLNIMIPFSVAE